MRALAPAVEEPVNTISKDGAHCKAVYKRHTFDFYKEDGGYMEKIVMGLPKPGGKKKAGSKLAINAFIIAIGDSMKIDYTIEEET